MAATQTAALAYIDDACRHRLSTRLESVFGSVDIDVADPRDSRLRIRASSIGDWWFSSFEGRGNTVITADQRALRFADHALLMLSLRGQTRPLRQRCVLPEAGQMMLSPWNESEALLSCGEFGYVCAYIPMSHLQTFAGRAIPYGRPLDALRGPGAMVGASLLALINESMRGIEPDRFAPMMPAFVDLLLSAFNDERQSAGGLPITSRWRRIIDYMNAQLGNASLSPLQLARATGLSTRQLCREFAQHGDSFSQRIRAMRLERARCLLRQAGLPVTQIAYDCGFSSPTVFGRVFRDAYGLSPRAYRARHH